MKVADIEVKLIPQNVAGSDLSVVNAARVSFDKESDWYVDAGAEDIGQTEYRVLRESDTKLINYLAKHKHYSPFNHTFLTFRIKAPIFVARQLVKHKFMPWNEISRRYVDSEPEFYFPDKWRGKAENVKQGSTDDEFSHPDFVGSSTLNQTLQSRVLGPVLEAYNHLIENGVCAEQARMILPQNIMTEWYWSGTLGAFADMLRLRLDPHTQLESRIVAQKILPLIEQIFPVSINALLSADKD